MRTFTTSLRALILLACVTLAAPLAAQEYRLFSGPAFNVSVGLSGAVDLQVNRAADGAMSMDGAFRDGDLAGDVSGRGRIPAFSDGYPACAEGQECLIFEGTIKLDSRSGFPDGTETTFVLHLAITGQSATGVYHIGPLIDFDFEQYGILDLDRIAS